MNYKLYDESERLIAVGSLHSATIAEVRRADDDVKVKALETGSDCNCIAVVGPPHVHIIVTEEKITHISADWDQEMTCSGPRS